MNNKKMRREMLVSIKEELAKQGAHLVLIQIICAPREYKKTLTGLSESQKDSAPSADIF